MNLPPENPPSTTPTLSSTPQYKVIRDYRLSYSSLDILIPGELEITFPRVCYLVLYFLQGDSFDMRFLNYHQSASQLYRFYIHGLVSEGSLSIRQRGKGSGYAIKIHPVIGYYLLRVPLSTLTDRQILLSEVLGKRGQLLHELEADLLLHPFENAYFQLLLEKILPDKSCYLQDPVYHAVNMAITKKGLLSVSALSQICCMSERTLRRQFLMKVGVSPQAYLKILQLQHVMELLLRKPLASLEQLAHEAGFYDVAHLRRDFRHKVSFRPSEVRQQLNGLSKDYLSFDSSA